MGPCGPKRVVKGVLERCELLFRIGVLSSFLFFFFRLLTKFPFLLGRRGSISASVSASVLEALAEIVEDFLRTSVSDVGRDLVERVVVDTEHFEGKEVDFIG